MSITITDSPKEFHPVYSPAIYIVSVAESLRSNNNFKYVAEIYEGTRKIAELKAYPNPQHGWGKFNVSDVIQNEVDEAVDFDSIVYGSDESFIQTEVRFGWEYIDGTGNFVRVLNNLSDSKKYFNGSPTYSEYVQLREDQGASSFHQYVLGNPIAYPLTSRRSIETFDWVRQWLYFLNGSTNARSLEVENMDTNISQTITQSSVITDNIIAWRVDKNSIEANTTFTDLQNWRVRTLDNSLTPVPTSEWIEYSLVETSKWEPYALYYLNRWGGIDTMPFTGRAVSEVSTERMTYKTDPNPVSPTGVVNYKTETPHIRTNWTENIERIELTTGWISHEAKESGVDLQSSPMVWIEDKNAVIRPVTITQESFRIEDQNVAEPIMLKMIVEYHELTKRQKS